MFGKSGRGSGKKLIRLDDGTSLLCEMDEFDNILPDTCEPLISEGHANTENLEYPKPKITRKPL